ncbi:MAG: porin, partial [Bacteroidales bacterium]|nr:porin [Bacteroidales bacterium]
MKRLFLIAAALLVGFMAAAQEEETPNYGYKEGAFASVPKVGAYIIGSYKYSDKEGANGGPGFNARLIRAYVDGSIYHQFNYRVQLQFNGGPHVKDFYVEWAKYKFFSVKMGQFKRAFTFENPMNPWDVGAGDFSFLVQKMAGMGDRLGEANMGGRDQGIQIQGDFLPVGKDEHPLFHYQLGLWNGQGINVTDKDLKKDIIGTFQVQPIKGMYAGVFAWKGDWVNPTSGDVFKRERLSYGVKFDRKNWTFRSEYAHNIAGEADQSGKSDAFY